MSFATPRPKPSARPAATVVRRGWTRSPRVLAAGAVVVALGLTGCAEAEQVARSAVEEAAREAVVEASGSPADAERAREQARQAVDDAIEQIPGTCSDLLRVPEATREDYAQQVLRGFWLSELETAEPPVETADAFAEAVAVRCDDSRETAASDVVTEVWEDGGFGPDGSEG